MEAFKESISNELSALSGALPEQIIAIIEPGKNSQLGDLMVNLPRFNKFKRIEGNTTELCKKWAESYPSNDSISASADGTTIYFKVDKTSILKKTINTIYSQQQSYGCSDYGKGQTILVEFSSPNIAKPFHNGHLRSTIIGNYIKNLHKTLGFNVTGINYLGDWGKQYGVLAVGFKKYGNEQDLKEKPIDHLNHVYVMINNDMKKSEEANKSIQDEARAYFKKMEDGDEEALAMWKKFKNLSMAEYKQIYARLNIDFDVYSGESMFSEEMKAEEAVMTQKKLLVESNGAMVIDLEDVKLGHSIIKKSDGTSIYMSRDVAAAHSRFKQYSFDKMYYAVSDAQQYHFCQLFAVLKKMEYDWSNKLTHIGFGLVLGEDGKPMSTRNGSGTGLKGTLDAAKLKMLDVMQKSDKFADIANPEATADIVGMSAIIVQDLSGRRAKNYVFSEARMSSFEGDTGPYLQYTHARLCSVERKAIDQGYTIHPDVDVSLLKEQVGLDVLAIVESYPSVVLSAVTKYDLESSTFTSYLFGLCHTVSHALEKLRVLGQEKQLAEARLMVYFCARVTLGNALRILGLKPLERM